MIVLKSSDDETFEVDVAVANQSQTIKNLLEDDCVKNGTIPLPNVSSKILVMVIEYCKRHVEAEGGENDEALTAFDEEFLEVDQTTLFDLIFAANYLNIKGLLDITCQTVVHMITKHKSPEQIRRIFNIKNDFTPEEEEQMREENPWAFEP
ncbi:hypothetical protein M9H77_01917 [Catharanthus roseus]|uniref:Uncharacterized protein n=2 Tax=Catharanthus roseus TaxID=4058 RepID=A0ACC0C6X0_CATRO|nr:SKP2-like protein [Catharanthus roseus]KAI5680690.1 hypothetical protein M9H77_01917 [Catharanthus roseus]